MKKEHFKVEGMDTQFVEFRHKENDLLFTRFERIRLALEEGQEEAKYLYFIYIFRKEHRVSEKNKMDKGPFNIICFNRVYHTYKDMTQNLDAILSEYILDEDEIFRCLDLVQSLDPNNI
ncbi:hypothetical protein BCJMU51_5469 [Bacillus cereus]|uniref:hypothetical protein n=2 Tax=Bacillus cereus TaxID=1396 RepID=UPI001F42B7D4|nr:hypothetical protein [Bacillus cereus]BCB40551.1 hypothetical protein BCM0045_5446 [Bacillus cereus]BCC03387.1 hypothetical protein BCM0057_5469 [Bacillus cereus]BCC38466.1 hypothetical protein BCM0105_5456 [Bacillus cereus]BCC44264.1 hypothetical protein BCJMU01_5431 [Bacillus cereus]BCC73779.1 hypothetical protein BCJMU51_5469 [Bacillus cereus]